LNKFHLCAPVQLSFGTSDLTVPRGKTSDLTVPRGKTSDLTVPSVPSGLNRRKGTDKFSTARSRVFKPAPLPEPDKLPLKFTPNSNSPFNFGADSAASNSPFNFGAPAAPVNFGADSAGSADTAKMLQDGGSIKNGNYKKWKSQKNNVRFSSYFKKSKKHKLKK